MYIDELKLSTKATNTLLRAGIRSVEKLCSVIKENKLAGVKSIDKDSILEIMEKVYCRNCKRSIYGEYKDCDINIENDGRYPNGANKCGVKVQFDISE
jgi:DNA-directed RNA polymerase alpha subunit